MAEFWFKIPGRLLRRWIDYKASQGSEFSEDDASVDLMLAVERGDLRPRRYYARRWGWSKSRVDRAWKDLLLRAERLKRHGQFESVGQVEPAAGQVEPKNSHEASKNVDSEPAAGQVEPAAGQYRIDKDKDKEISLSRAREGPQGGGEVTGEGPQGGGEAGQPANRHSKGRAYTLYPLERVKQVAQLVGVSDLEAEKFFWHYENAGWEPVRNLKASLQKWKLNGYQYGRIADRGRNGVVDPLHSNDGLPGAPPEGTVPRFPNRTPARPGPKRDGELSNYEYLIRCGYSDEQARRLAGGSPVTGEPATGPGGDPAPEPPFLEEGHRR